MSMHNEVLERVIEKHGEEHLDPGVISQQLEGVFDALSTENVDLDELIQDLQQRLDDALMRKNDVLVILGTLQWLEENIFDKTVIRGAVRDVLGQDFSGYKSLLSRLYTLHSSQQLDENGRFIPWDKRRFLDPTKFSGVTEEKDVFRCPKCQLGFRDEEDLERHVKSNCEYKDEEAFYQKRDDIREMRKSRFDLNKKLYCDVCDYTAKSVGGMASHKRGKEHKRRRAGILVMDHSPVKKKGKTSKAKTAKKKTKKGKKR